MKPSKCRVMCPDCGKPKMQFETESAANRFIQFNGEELTDDISNLRVYYCPSCCCYHITSKPEKKRNTSTQRMLDAYYQDNGKKEKVINQIRTIVNTCHILTIPETGYRKVYKFNIEKNCIFGINKTEEKWNLHEMLYCDLAKILKRLTQAYNKHEQDVEFNKFIDNITNIVNLEPSITIEPTGEFKVVSFYRRKNGKLSAVTEGGHKKSLNNIPVNELNCVLERLLKKHYNLEIYEQTTN